MPDASTTEYSIAAVPGGVTAAQGFRSAAVASGIKKKPGALDLVVIAADRPVPAAGLFTTNLAQAAPVLVSKQHLEAAAGRARAVVVNAGCANACTGAEGLANATRMTADVATALGCAPEQVLVASTGVIGVGLPMDKVTAGIAQATAALARGRGSDAALAIMTTDPFPKEYAVTVHTAAGSFGHHRIFGAGRLFPCRTDPPPAWRRCCRARCAIPASNCRFRKTTLPQFGLPFLPGVSTSEL